MTSLGLVTAAPAVAAADPNHISFTLEGCRGDAGLFPATGPFVCPDALYTTGNLGKGWNELDLVPHRLTTSAGSQADVTTSYTIAIVADASRNGAPGYDFISVPVAQNPSACGITAGAMTTLNPGFGGADTSLYRLVTITQAAGSTCVFDYYQRLALGSAAFSGSSLQSNLANQSLGSQGIGEKRVSIPDVGVAQTLSKDMTASQGSDHIWTVTKSPSPSTLNFNDTCAPTATFSRDVTITVSWTKGPADPSGPVTVVTHVYANNPAHRPIQVSVTDNIYAGTTPTGAILDTSSAGPTTVPAETDNFLILTHTATLTSGPTDFNDVATGTYTDLVPGLPPINLTATASATAPVQASGPELNQSATITDTESITGTGLSFSVATPSVGSFTGGYVAGTHTTGPVGWSSGSQSSSGSVDFHKTVYLDQPRITSGTLSDSANLTGSDGATSSSSASVDISSTATVSLTINKTIPVVLGAGDASETFTFPVTGAGTANPTITFSSGDGGSLHPKSTTVTGLAPGSYTVNETTLAPYAPQSPQTVPINLPTCSGAATFTNNFGPASAQARKVTVPAGSEAGWDLILTGPGTPVGGEHVTTTGTAFVPFTTVLQEGSYTITETPQAGWDQTGASSECSFTVNYPADADRVFSCTITNTQRGSITIIKDAIPDDQQDFAYTTTGTGLSAFALDDDADPTLLNTRTFSNLVPGSGYSVTETLPVAGWDFTSLHCVSTNHNSTLGTSGAVATITLAPGDSVTCTYTNTKRGHVTVLKTENGGVPNHAYSFELKNRAGTPAFDQTLTTSAGNAGSLDFGLLPPGDYTLCELAVPAGTHSTLQDQGGVVNPTTGDICLDFTLAAGQTKAFVIDNQLPGGGQRTIGYWKNWNSCSTTGNNRVLMAAKTGNHLMDEFLPVSLGNYVVDTCAKGVAVLAAASGKYAENQLAAQLLAAELNIKAGASTCTSVNQAISDANALLVTIGYKGPPSSIIGSSGPNSQYRTQALALATTLNNYNNGLIC